jgi:uncharacterized membrane protein (DUF373 family)
MTSNNNNTIKTSQAVMAKNASLIVGTIGVIAIVQLIKMYYNIYTPDAFIYALTAFLVVLNLITIYILIRNQRRASTSMSKYADLSGIEIDVMYN